ncbi:hypothetical protein JRQ81_006734 [Phrynocephalus forsythii]|uniref:Spatacsin n=1 Tax=Phrynocephalus forsythii TaxID=171643 RepID=A0A9Q0XGX0_9SAUR|nr:hypothetical protein JRQ81_006734 [Phrynocephalus forsythii]
MAAFRKDYTSRHPPRAARDAKGLLRGTAKRPRRRLRWRPRGRREGTGKRRRIVSEAEGMAEALRVFLLGPRSPQGGVVGAKLSRGQRALAFASETELVLTGLAPALQEPLGGVSLPGAWEDFMWESVELDDPAVDNLKLLAVSRTHELFVYEVILDAGKCNATLLQSCSEDRLKKLITSKNISLCSISSMRVLSFKNGKAVLLLNNVIIAHLAFWGAELEAEELKDYFLLDLSPETLERVVDATFCRGVLFILDKSGWIYVFNAVDGAYLACVHVSSYLAEEEETKNVDTHSPLALLKVSHDLSIAVIANSSNWIAAVDLNLYFRQYPEHLFCKKKFNTYPIEEWEGTEEEDLRSSDCNVALLQHTFRTDRSWKEYLSTLQNTTKICCSPNLINYVYFPWYQSVLHLEHPECKTHEASKSSLIQDAAYVLSSSKDKGSKSKRDRKWRFIHSEYLKDCMKFECKSVTGFSALFTILSQSKGLVIVLWTFETQDIICSCIGKNSFVLECSNEEQLSVIFSEHGISLLLFGLSQEEFLNRLIIHGSAGAVDSLCRLNGWGRCSIPVHALEAGLENHQLDTVDFFLKNKENLFSHSACSLQDHPASNISDFYLKSVEELRPALDLLYKAIQENDLEVQTKHFSERLLNLTLSFLNRLLCGFFINSEELDENLETCVDILTSYTSKLRMFMIKFPVKLSCFTSPRCVFEEEVPQIEQSQMWEELEVEQVISEAILNNKLPEAQTFCRLAGKPGATLEELTQIGLDLVYKSLLKDDIKEASKLLRNLGLSVMEQLHRICFYVTDKHLCDVLVNVLQEKNYFSETEREMIDFVHHVEKVYSQTIPEDENNTAQSRHWVKKQDPSSHKAPLDAFFHWEGDRIHNREKRIMLNWAQQWDQVAREMILLPTRHPQEFKSCNPLVVWMYLSSWHEWGNISSWIEECHPQGRSTSWPQLTLETIYENILCSYYMQNEILDNLARNGIFMPAELEEFECLLQRLNLIGGVMQNPQPLPKPQSICDLDIHNCFILYCLEHGLDYLLYMYLDYYSLHSSDSPILNDKAVHEAHPWFEFLVRCRNIASNPGDVKRIFQASLANAQVLIPSNQASVSTMLLEGRTLLALATTMFAPGGIDQVVNNGNGGKRVDAQLYRMALAPYPKLKAVLFPQYASHGILPSDISLYHLVQSLAPFDPTKLFGWHSTNALAFPDACSDLPHFSRSAVVSKYAEIEHLDFCYYLHHQRPSCAFGTFLVHQLAKSKNPKQLIQQAGNSAYFLALSFFHKPSVAAACVCFLELLGLDSLKLRVDLKAANIILSFMSRRDEPQHNSIRQSLVDKLTELAYGEKAAATELLVCLEEAVWEKIEHQGIKKSSGDARKQWSLVVHFCRLHNIKLSTSYLKMCARANEWLQFVTEAQMFSYQPTEITLIFQDFRHPLQDHLRLAFQAPDVQLEEQHSTVHLPGHNEHGQTMYNVFHILLQCQQQPHPWCYLLGETVKHHAPVLSVLAACFQDVHIIHCLCVWIITSLDISTTAEMKNYIEDSLQTHEWNLQDLTALWEMLLRKQKNRTLLHGFQLFLKDSPLKMMLEVYELCMTYKNYSEAQIKLLAFQASLLKLQASYEVPQSILSVPWLESQASFLLEQMLQQCRTQYELGKLFQVFADTDTVLPYGPNMKKMSALSCILKDSSISVDPALLRSYTDENFQTECRRILKQLQERCCFSMARAVAELAELPVDDVVIQEVLQNIHLLKQIGHWSQKRTRIEFWKKCHDSFVRNGVSSQAASNFFATQADSVSESLDETRTSSIVERQFLLTLAGHWLARADPVSLHDLEQIEKKIWLCRIIQQTLSHSTGQAKHGLSHHVAVSGELSFDSLIKEFSFSKITALNMPKYLELEGLPSQDALQTTLSDDEMESLNILIGHLLDEGSVHEASRVCRYFRVYSRDVSLVLHCRALAAGETSQNSFHPEIQALVAAQKREENKAKKNGEEGSKKRLQSNSGMEHFSFVGDISTNNEVVGSLQTLIAECVHGRNYCRQVLCLYELSKEIDCSFSEIRAHDSEELLRVILSSQQPDRCKKAQAFINTQELDPEIVAEIVADEITQELLASLQGKADRFTSYFHVMSLFSSMQSFTPRDLLACIVFLDAV